MVRLACVFCTTLVEVLVLDACLVMSGVELDPFCYNVCFCFLLSIQVGVLKNSKKLI